jgi:hypothetical protein
MPEIFRRQQSENPAALRYSSQSAAPYRVWVAVFPHLKGAGSVVIEGARGAFRFSTGTQNKGDVKIKTSSGTLGIRG